MRKVAITTLGCKINQFESAAMGESLGREGFELVPFEAGADIYVINTCTVTAKTDAESRRLIRRAQKHNPAARVVVTGCYAQVSAEELREMPGVDMIIGNVEKQGIAELLKMGDSGQKVLVSDIAKERTTGTLRLESFAEHTRAFLQVQNGCDAFCSYCIVPYARGRSRSVPVEEALSGIRTFAEKGFREVVLTGIHLGAYGLDLDPPTSLLALLEEAERERLVPRLRIGSVEPNEVSAALIAFLARSEIVCPHLHIPLQSGDDRTLARMNRRYAAASFGETVRRLVAAVPDICIGCDIIAGFPGESEEEFASTLALVSSLPIAYLHVFPFSRRPGTPAASMEGQVDARLVRSRAEALRRLSEAKKKEYCCRFVGRELRVLVQGGEGKLSGLSRNYIQVTLTGGAPPANAEVTARITGSTGDSLLGEIVPTLPE